MEGKIMFTEIVRINKKGELKNDLINTDHITGIVELSLEPTNLYDEEGNLVKTEEPTEKLYKVFIEGGLTLKISEDTYNTLVKKLVK